MRILHTADWHLGQTLMYRDRTDEHQLALDWLLEQIVEHQVDGLLVAGDVFDIANPPNYARRLYYHFLTRLQQTPCRHVLIVGGNHDSPSMLEAPAALLELLKVKVVGAAPEKKEEAIIEWRTDGNLQAVVAAVPFLRDRDIKTAGAGESAQERMRRIQEAIRDHYHAMAAGLEPYEQAGIPLLTTGHLYAKGASASARQDNIYIGNLENIDAEQMPERFDYVALGHLHRPQLVGDQTHIRYSGSLIPLSFSETKDEKGAWLVEFEGRTRQAITFLPAPTFRRLKTITGDPDAVKTRLRAFDQRDHGPLKPWVEVRLPGRQAPPGFDRELRAFVEEEQLDLDILKLTLEGSAEGEDQWEEETGDLQALSDLDVFARRCEEAGCTEEETQGLLDTFRELLNWMEEHEEETER